MRPSPLTMDHGDPVIFDPPPAGMATLLGRTSTFMHSGKKTAESTRTPVKQLNVDVDGLPSPGAVLRTTPLAAFTPISTPSPSQRFSLFSRPDWGKLQPVLPEAHREEATESNSAESDELVPLPDRLEQDISGDESEPDVEGSNTAEQQKPVGSIDNIPSKPPGALHPSVGSEGHALGVCKRCCFFPRGRCLNGYACEFCHYQHEKRKRKNKKGTKTVSSVRPFPPHFSGTVPRPTWVGGVPFTTSGAAGFAAPLPSCALTRPAFAPSQLCMNTAAQCLYPASSVPAYQVPVAMQAPQGSTMCGNMQLKMNPVHPMYQQAPAPYVFTAQMPMGCQGQSMMMAQCAPHHQQSMQVVMLDPALMSQQPQQPVSGVQMAPPMPQMPSSCVADVPPPPAQPPTFGRQYGF